MPLCGCDLETYHDERRGARERQRRGAGEADQAEAPAGGGHGPERRALFIINDLDAGATQYTVSNQMVNATLMNS